MTNYYTRLILFFIVNKIKIIRISWFSTVKLESKRLCEKENYFCMKIFDKL